MTWSDSERLIVGEIVELMLVSPVHAQWRLRAIERSVLPPVRLGQYKIWRDVERDAPIGYASWAFMSEEASETYVRFGRLPDGCFDSGPLPWLVDLIAPYGHCLQFVRELQVIMGRRRVFWRRTAPDLTLRKLGHAVGKDTGISA